MHLFPILLSLFCFYAIVSPSSSALVSALSCTNTGGGGYSYTKVGGALGTTDTKVRAADNGADGECDITITNVEAPVGMSIEGLRGASKVKITGLRCTGLDGSNFNSRPCLTLEDSTDFSGSIEVNGIDVQTKNCMDETTPGRSSCYRVHGIRIHNILGTLPASAKVSFSNIRMFLPSEDPTTPYVSADSHSLIAVVSSVNTRLSNLAEFAVRGCKIEINRPLGTRNPDVDRLSEFTIHRAWSANTTWDNVNAIYESNSIRTTAGAAGRLVVQNNDPTRKIRVAPKLLQLPLGTANSSFSFVDNEINVATELVGFGIAFESWCAVAVNTGATLPHHGVHSGLDTFTVNDFRLSVTSYKAEEAGGQPASVAGGWTVGILFFIGVRLLDVAGDVAVTSSSINVVDVTCNDKFEFFFIWFSRGELSRTAASLVVAENTITLDNVSVVGDDSRDIATVSFIEFGGPVVGNFTGGSHTGIFVDRNEATLKVAAPEHVAVIFRGLSCSAGAIFENIPTIAVRDNKQLAVFVQLSKRIICRLFWLGQSFATEVQLIVARGNHLRAGHYSNDGGGGGKFLFRPAPPVSKENSEFIICYASSFDIERGGSIVVADSHVELVAPMVMFPTSEIIALLLNVDNSNWALAGAVNITGSSVTVGGSITTNEGDGDGGAIAQVRAATSATHAAVLMRVGGGILTDRCSVVVRGGISTKKGVTMRLGPNFYGNPVETPEIAVLRCTGLVETGSSFGIDTALGASYRLSTFRVLDFTCVSFVVTKVRVESTIFHLGVKREAGAAAASERLALPADTEADIISLKTVPSAEQPLPLIEIRDCDWRVLHVAAGGQFFVAGIVFKPAALGANRFHVDAIEFHRTNLSLLNAPYSAQQPAGAMWASAVRVLLIDTGLDAETNGRFVVFRHLERARAANCHLAAQVWAKDVMLMFFLFQNKVLGNENATGGGAALSVIDSTLSVSQEQSLPVQQKQEGGGGGGGTTAAPQQQQQQQLPRFRDGLPFPQKLYMLAVRLRRKTANVRVFLSRVNVTIYGGYHSIRQQDVHFLGVGETGVRNPFLRSSVAAEDSHILSLDGDLIVFDEQKVVASRNLKIFFFVLIFTAFDQCSELRIQRCNLTASGIAASYADTTEIAAVAWKDAKAGGGPVPLGGSLTGESGSPAVNLIFEDIHIDVSRGGTLSATDSTIYVLDLRYVGPLLSPLVLLRSSIKAALLPHHDITRDLFVQLISINTAQDILGRSGIRVDGCSIFVTGKLPGQRALPRLFSGFGIALVAARHVLSTGVLITRSSVRVQDVRAHSVAASAALFFIRSSFSDVKALEFSDSSVAVHRLAFTHTTPGGNLLARVVLSSAFILANFVGGALASTVRVARVAVDIEDVAYPRLVPVDLSLLTFASLGSLSFAKPVTVVDSTLTTSRVRIQDSSNLNPGREFLAAMSGVVGIAGMSISDYFEIVVQRTSVVYRGFEDTGDRAARQREAQTSAGFVVVAGVGRGASPPFTKDAVVSVSASSVRAEIFGRDDARTHVVGVTGARIKSLSMTNISIRGVSARTRIAGGAGNEENSFGHEELSVVSLMLEAQVLADVSLSRIVVEAHGPCFVISVINATGGAGLPETLTVEKSRFFFSHGVVMAALLSVGPATYAQDTQEQNKPSTVVTFSNNKFIVEQTPQYPRPRCSIPFLLFGTPVTVLRLEQEHYTTVEAGGTMFSGGGADAVVKTLQVRGRCSFVNDVRLNEQILEKKSSALAQQAVDTAGDEDISSDASAVRFVRQSVLPLAVPASAFSRAAAVAISAMDTSQLDCGTFSSSLSIGTRTGTRSNSTTFQVKEYRPKIVLPESFAGAGSVTTAGGFLAPASYALSLRILALARMTQCPSDAREIPPVDFSGGNVLGLRIGDAPLETQRGAVVSGLLVCALISGAVGLPVLFLVSWWIARHEQYQQRNSSRNRRGRISRGGRGGPFWCKDRLEVAARKFAFPTSFVFGAAFILAPTTADAATTLFVAMPSPRGADVFLGVLGMLLAAASLSVFLWIGREVALREKVVVEEPAPFDMKVADDNGSGGDDEEQEEGRVDERRNSRSNNNNISNRRNEQQRQRQPVQTNNNNRRSGRNGDDENNGQEEEEEEATACTKLPLPFAFIVALWHWISDQWANWRSSRFVDLTCCSTTYDGYKSVSVAVLDFAMSILITAVSGASNGCGTSSCCTSLSIVVLAACVCHGIVVLCTRPYCTRFDVVFGAVSVLIAIVAAALLVAIVAGAEGAMAAFVVVGEVAQILSFVGVMQVGIIPVAIAVVDFFQSMTKMEGKRRRALRQQLLDEVDQEMMEHRARYERQEDVEENGGSSWSPNNRSSSGDGGSSSRRTASGGGRQNVNSSGSRSRQQQQSQSWRLNDRHDDDDARRPSRSRRHEQTEDVDDENYVSMLFAEQQRQQQRRLQEQHRHRAEMYRQRHGRGERDNNGYDDDDNDDHDARRRRPTSYSSSSSRSRPTQQQEAINLSPLSPGAPPFLFQKADDFKFVPSAAADVGGGGGNVRFQPLRQTNRRGSAPASAPPVAAVSSPSAARQQPSSSQQRGREDGSGGGQRKGTQQQQQKQQHPNNNSGSRGGGTATAATDSRRHNQQQQQQQQQSHRHSSRSLTRKDSRYEML